MTRGPNASTSRSITASGVIDRSHTRRSAPAWRSPPAMRSTVTALPRTDGNANGVTTAIRSGIAARIPGSAPHRPGKPAKNRQAQLWHLIIDGDVRVRRLEPLRDRVSADRRASRRLLRWGAAATHQIGKAAGRGKGENSVV